MSGFITYEDGKGRPSQPNEELVACLEALGEYVDNVPTDDAEVYNSEHLTACWQTIELVSQLMREHFELLALMEEFIEAQRKLERAPKLVTAGAGDHRHVAREMGLPPR